MLKISFTGLDDQGVGIREKLNRSLNKVFDHGKFILGPEVFELEERLAEYCGAKYCISCANGTDALQITLMALGVENGSEVITPGFSYISSAEAAKLLGAKIKYVDIDPKTFNIDVSKIEEKITKKTRAIIPVSLFGQCAEMEKINEIAGKYNLPVVEDAAQSFGGKRHLRRSCNLSLVGCTSFFPSKPLGCYGDGGAIFTSDKNLATRIRRIARHGQEGKYNHVALGINSRLDTIQAAILLVKLDIFEDELTKKQEMANIYDKFFKKNNLDIAPYISSESQSAWAQYTIKLNKRDLIRKKLTEAGIPTAIYYPKTLSEQPSVRDNKVKLPIGKKIAEKVLSLPINPYLSKNTISQLAIQVSTIIKEN